MALSGEFPDFVFGSRMTPQRLRDFAGPPPARKSSSQQLTCATHTRSVHPLNAHYSRHRGRAGLRHAEVPEDAQEVPHEACPLLQPPECKYR
jgi:hypothetical protein